MKSSYLLDTHTLLWFLNGNENISTRAKNIISNSNNRCFISIASLWEISIKIKLGKLKLVFALKELGIYLIENNIEILPISFEHILELMTLGDYHKDPFDRIIIAQAKYEKLVILSKMATSNVTRSACFGNRLANYLISEIYIPHP